MLYQCLSCQEKGGESWCLPAKNTPESMYR
jgi:hypothetical protein